MTFEEYLITKKIDQNTFQNGEHDLYESWKAEFEQVHPNSFTAQKLYLINPLRRKYVLKQETVKVTEEKLVPEKKEDAVDVTMKSIDSIISPASSTEEKTSHPEVKPAQSSKPARPVFKPKPKIN